MFEKIKIKKKENLKALFEIIKKNGFIENKSLPIDLNIEHAPWIWLEDSEVEINFYKKNDRILAFSIIRIKDFNVHLHALWINSQYRGMGFGLKIMKIIEEEAGKKCKNLQSFTLHVYKNNIKAISFYEKLGFKIFHDTPGEINNGILEWINSCKRLNNWPLRSEIFLMLNLY